jgi:hypothetical protein
MLIFVGNIIKQRQDRFRIFPLIHADNWLDSKSRKLVSR